MSTTKIRTNNHWREFKPRCEVPDKVLASQFDWTDDDFEKHGDYSDGFIQYHGHWYHLGDFMRDKHFEGWDGVAADGFFSGVVISLSDDGERYKIGTYA